MSLTWAPRSALAGQVLLLVGILVVACSLPGASETLDFALGTRVTPESPFRVLLTSASLQLQLVILVVFGTLGNTREFGFLVRTSSWEFGLPANPPTGSPAPVYPSPPSVSGTASPPRATQRRALLSGRSLGRDARRAGVDTVGELYGSADYFLAGLWQGYTGTNSAGATDHAARPDLPEWSTGPANADWDGAGRAWHADVLPPTERVG